MVREAISNTDLDPLIRLQETVKVEIYKQILRQFILPHLRSSSVQPPIFVQDNASCHTAKRVEDFSSDEGVDFVDRPAESTDLKSIDCV